MIVNCVLFSADFDRRLFAAAPSGGIPRLVAMSRRGNLAGRPAGSAGGNGRRRPHAAERMPEGAGPDFGRSPLCVQGRLPMGRREKSAVFFCRIKKISDNFLQICLYCLYLHRFRAINCCCSSVVEHFLGKEEVTSSSLVNSSESRGYPSGNLFFRAAVSRMPRIRRSRQLPSVSMPAASSFPIFSQDITNKFWNPPVCVLDGNFVFENFASVINSNSAEKSERCFAISAKYATFVVTY